MMHRKVREVSQSRVKNYWVEVIENNMTGSSSASEEQYSIIDFLCETLRPLR